MSASPYPNHLRAWREYRRMTQEELADAVGVSKASVGHWETGERKLSVKWLPKVASVLQTSAGYILEHDPNDLPDDVLEIWAGIPEEARPQALEVLKAFKRAS